MDPVLVEKRTGYRVLTLNRPDRLNAVNIALLEAMNAAVADAAKDSSCRALLLTGAGRAFCSGQDLNDRLPKPDMRVVVGETLLSHYHPLIEKLRALPYPVVAAVNGVAAGAGCNLALAADIVIAARSASFVQAFIRIGLIPDVGGTWILPRLVGMARARGLAMTGEPLDAAKAEQWGLIWKCVDDAALMKDAEALCAQFAKAPTVALGFMKRAFDASTRNDLQAQLALEHELQREAGSTPDFLEGICAFMEKRAPNFTGKKAGEKT
ncbi:MAG: 2-(1,2-epoxy-1,2-dihydrophenyl)acetyl-CoA isomerase [Pseudolabrys sp.]|nr:2-(1,2-epoxy-1,2-dihydrophenyl)acetyl-CoA isomerase [Pseudolabrys sp.]